MREDGVRTAEIFGYSDIGKWPGNPEVHSWVFKNGIYQPTQDIIGCSETLEIIGAENMFRRSTRNLDDYMKRYPHLGDLEPHSTISL